MSRKSLVIIILLSLLLGTTALFFLLGGKAPVLDDIRDSLPFGTAPEGQVPAGGTGETGEQSTTTPATVGTPGKPLPRFSKLSDAPIAGAVSFARGSTTLVRYVDRATGHVFEVNLQTLERTQVINITDPQVYQAVWKSDGTGFISRTVERGSDSVSNTSVTLVPPKATSTQNLYTAQSTPIRGTITELAVLPGGNLLYSLEDSGAVVTSSFAGGSLKTLFTLPFTSWRFDPVSASSALIYTKASAYVPGYAYIMNLSSGGLNKILGPLNGLTAKLSPDSKRVAFTHMSSDTAVFSVFTLGGATTDIFPVTLAEKCVWSRKSSSILFCSAPEGGLSPDMLDLWYQGSHHFSDRVWRFDAVTGSASSLVDPARNFDIAIDATDLSLSPAEDYLFMTNKTDSSLWALKLLP